MTVIESLIVYTALVALAVGFFLERRSRKKLENELFTYVANRVNPLKSEVQNNEKASKNSYRKLVQDLEQTNSRISGQSLEVASLKRDMQMAGIFITEE